MPTEPAAESTPDTSVRSAAAAAGRWRRRNRTGMQPPGKKRRAQAARRHAFCGPPSSGSVRADGGASRPAAFPGAQHGRVHALLWGQLRLAPDPVRPDRSRRRGAPAQTLSLCGRAQSGWCRQAPRPPRTQEHRAHVRLAKQAGQSRRALRPAPRASSSRRTRS